MGLLQKARQAHAQMVRSIPVHDDYRNERWLSHLSILAAHSLVGEKAQKKEDYKMQTRLGLTLLELIWLY